MKSAFLLCCALLVSGALAWQRCPCKTEACKDPKPHCASCYAAGSTRIDPGDIAGMCASCEKGYTLGEDNRCYCTHKPCAGSCPAGQVWAGFLSRQWLDHNALSAPRLFGWTCQKASRLGCSVAHARNYLGCTRCSKGYMLADTTTPPDFRPALGCLQCGTVGPDAVMTGGWTSNCTGVAGRPLTCQPGDQVCRSCPAGRYIDRIESWRSLGKAVVCGDCSELSCAPGACGLHGCTKCAQPNPYKIDYGTYSDCVDFNPN